MTTDIVVRYSAIDSSATAALLVNCGERAFEARSQAPRAGKQIELSNLAQDVATIRRRAWRRSVPSAVADGWIVTADGREYAALQGVLSDE